MPYSKDSVTSNVLMCVMLFSKPFFKFLFLDMLEYLIQLPCEVLGQSVLGFLDMVDIIQLENAAASQESQQLLREILPYCPPIALSDAWNNFQYKSLACGWFNKMNCRVKLSKVSLGLLSEVNFMESVLVNVELNINDDISLNDIKQLNDSYINQRVTYVEIEGDQDPAVMEALFSLLTSSSIRSLDIETSTLSKWMEHIKKIGPCLRELSIHNTYEIVITVKTITEYCPYLKKLMVGYLSRYSDTSKVLQSIASNCQHLRNLYIHTSAECIADLTAVAEKCPQLEELSLYCKQLTDQSVIALAQHCSRLKKLYLNQCQITAASLIALSERGLPLEELDIPRIPIRSAEIAAQCAHALSRIRGLCTFNETMVCNGLQYMTGLRGLHLNNNIDGLLLPHLLPVQQGHFAELEILILGDYCCITYQQVCEFAARCPKLHTLTIRYGNKVTNAVLVQLARSCPHLQKVTLGSSKVTEEGVLALAAHCRQLREIDIPYITVTEETVRQMAQHCRRFTKLNVIVCEREGEVIVARNKRYSGKEIRALKETVRQRDRESSNAKVIVHNSSHNTCLIL